MSVAQLADFLCRLPADQFLLHGSIHRLDILKPQQTHFDGTEDWQKLCGVYATPLIEIALVKATVAGPHDSWGWKFNWGKLAWRRRLRLEPNFEIHIWEEVSLGSGFIYILDRRVFSPLPDAMSYIAYEPVIPLAILEVTPEWYDYFHIQHKIYTSALAPKS